MTQEASDETRRGRGRLLGYQRADHRRDRDRDRHAVPLDRVEARRRVERREDHERTAHPQQPDEGGSARDVEERRDREVDVVGLEAARQRLVERVRDQVAMGEHHALRPAGRAAGEVQQREVVLGHLGGSRRWRRVVEQHVPLFEGDDRATTSARGPGSRSVTSTFGRAAWTIETSSGAASRVLSGSSTMPAVGTPMYASTYRWQFAARIATRSPGARPSDASAGPTRLTPACELGVGDVPVLAHERGALGVSVTSAFERGRDRRGGDIHARKCVTARSVSAPRSR